MCLCGLAQENFLLHVLLRSVLLPLHHYFRQVQVFLLLQPLLEQMISQIIGVHSAHLILRFLLQSCDD